MRAGQLVSQCARNRAKKRSQNSLTAFWRRYRQLFLGAVLPLAMVAPAWADIFLVTKTEDDGTPGTLRYAIEQANSDPTRSDIIQFSLIGPDQTITLDSYLPIITKTGASLEIVGQGSTVIDGQGEHRPFFVNSGEVTISNLTIQNGMAKGGDGGNATSTGGGGGLGAGGAIFVRTGASVTVDSVSFLNNSAEGGQGGTNGGPLFVSGAGGGGMGGDGGSAVGQSGGGGGGGAFAGQDGQAALGNVGGDGGGPNGGAGGAGVVGVAGAAGGEFSGGGGGGGQATAAGGAGGFGGGGGGATSSLGSSGGAGGFGGGGGSSPTGGGAGGFGGGGGATVLNSTGVGGFGGGSGDGQNGGGGAGFGGAIFVMEGATLTIQDSGFSQGSVTAGLGGNASALNAGQAAGSALFLQDTDVTINVSLNHEMTISDTIADAAGISQPGGIIKTGTGTLVLSGMNTYSGGTRFNEGVVAITSAANLGFGSLSFHGGTLRTDASVTLTNALEVWTGDGTFDTNGYDSQWTLSAGGVAPGSGLTKTGEGTLTINGEWGIWGHTAINQGTLLIADQTDNTSIANNSSHTVNSGGTLRGMGTTYATTVNAGGTLAAGTADAVGTLTLAELTLNDGAIVEMRVGERDTFGGAYNDNFIVQGDLTLNGTLNLIDNAPGEFQFGTYRLMTYSGTLTNNGMEIGTLPGEVAAAQLQILELEQEVNVVLQGALFFNGDVTAADGTIYGGAGVWDSTTTNWTDTHGNDSLAWDDAIGVFAGVNGGGQVTVVGEQTFSGLQFSKNGYELIAGTDGSLMLDGVGRVRVDDGVEATFNLPITGTGSLEKMDAGTLILSGTNTYSGGTTFKGGVLAVTEDNNLGTGNLTFDGGTLRTDAGITSSKNLVFNAAGGTIDTNGFDSTFTGSLSGSGDLTKTGAGALGLSGVHGGYTGDIHLNGGVLALSGGNITLGNGSIQANGGDLYFGNDVSSQTLNNDIVLNSDLVIERNNAFPGGGITSLNGDLSGSGKLTFQKTDGSSGVSLWLMGNKSLSGKYLAASKCFTSSERWLIGLEYS